MRNFYLACKTIQELHLNSNAILVYYDLCSRANKDDQCWPSKKTIAIACNVSVSTVTRSLRELEKSGMIVTISRYRSSNNRQTSNRYKIFDTPHQFTEPKEPNDSESEQALFSKDTEPENQPTFMEQDIELLQTPPESPVSACEPELQSYTPVNDSSLSERPESKKDPAILPQPNYSNLSSLQLLFCFLMTFIDTLPHVSVTPQGTISRRKVTDNLRKESILSKLPKWYIGQRSKNPAGLGYCLAKNE